MGRTGALWAHQHADRARHHDVGQEARRRCAPRGAARDEPVACFEHGDQGGTFTGSMAAGVGCAVIETRASARVPRRGRARDGRVPRRSRLGGLAGTHGHGGGPRARPPARTSALDARRRGRRSPRVAIDRGLLVNAPRPDTLALHAGVDRHARRGRRDVGPARICSPRELAHGGAAGRRGARGGPVNPFPARPMMAMRTRIGNS